MIVQEIDGANRQEVAHDKSIPFTRSRIAAIRSGFSFAPALPPGSPRMESLIPLGDSKLLDIWSDFGIFQSLLWKYIVTRPITNT